MRTISAALKTAQESSNRYPISKIEVFDSMLRWSEFMATYTSDVSDDFAEILESTASDMPAAYCDASYYDGSIYAGATGQASGPELILNSSFESGLGNWFEEYDDNSNVTVESSTEIVHSGTASMKISMQTAYAVNACIRSNYFSATPGEWYSVNAWIAKYAISPLPTTMSLMLSWYDSSDNLISSSTIDITDYQAWWTQISFQSLAPVNADYGGIRVSFVGSAGYNAMLFYIDDVSVKNFPDGVSVVYALGSPQGVVYTNGGEVFPCRLSVNDNVYYYIAQDESSVAMYYNADDMSGGTESGAALTRSEFGHALAVVETVPDGGDFLSEGYHAYIVDGSYASDADFHINIEAFDNADNVEPMDYTIAVPAEYTNASLSWFDAVRLDDGTDIIVFNLSPTGFPNIIVRRNGVWGDYFPMLPIDVVDNYSYLRIGWMKVYDGIIYATGELGRRGSTGLHPQSMAVVLRSIDGIHWSLDRWRYLGETPFRSPLLIDESGFAYYTYLPDIFRAPLTPLFGLSDSDASDGDHVYFEIEDDILQWSAEIAADRAVGSMGISLSDNERQYSSLTSETLIKPGYMIRLSAGYKAPTGDEFAQIGWYGVDSIGVAFGSSIANLNLSCSEWNMRALNNNFFDQDWQWLSHTGHYDDCDRNDYLYSIGGGTVRMIDSTPPLQSGTAVNAGNLKVYSEVDKTVLVSTVPFDAQGGFASVGFTVDGATDEELDSLSYYYARLMGLNEFGLGYDLANKKVGIGAGAAIIKDEHNFITAFVDVRTQQLILLRVFSSGLSDEDEEEIWTQLDIRDVSDYVPKVWVIGAFNERIYEPWIDVRGSTIYYGLIANDVKPQVADAETLYSVTKATVAASPYAPNEIDTLTYVVSNVPRNGENRFGVVLGTASPTLRFALQDEWNNFDTNGLRSAPRSLSDYNNGASIIDQEEEYGHQPYYLESSDYTWDEFFSADIRPTLNPPAFLHVEQQENQRLLLTTTVESSVTKFSFSSRGDYITGLWEIRDIGYSGSYTESGGVTYWGLWLFLDPDDCYPPGEDGSYWASTFTYAEWLNNNFSMVPGVFWIMDGDYAGHYLEASSYVWVNGDNIVVPVQKVFGPTALDMPAIGDHVIFCPGMRVMTYNKDYGNGDRSIYWSNSNEVGVTLKSFAASDLEREKSIQWTLDDIAAKAGVLTTLGGLSDGAKEYFYSESAEYTGEPGNYHWLDGVYKDFSIKITTTDPFESGDWVNILLGAQSNDYPSAWQGESGNGVRIDIYSNFETGFVEAKIYSYYNTVKLEHCFFEFEPERFHGARNFRFVRKGDSIALWVEERCVLSYPIRQRHTDSAFASSMLEYGYVAWQSMLDGNGYTATIERLWQPIDGIVADQGASALAAMGRVIRDARIRTLADEDLAIRISNFTSRDDCGTAPLLALLDRTELTDRMASHIRVIGEEIGEYFDHAAAAEYGVMFSSRNVESLKEEDAYQEAINGVKETQGINHGRQITIGAQLQYEPEDIVEIVYTGVDGRAVSQECIINSISLRYDRPKLEMNLSLRENYGV